MTSLERDIFFKKAGANPFHLATLFPSLFYVFPFAKMHHHMLHHFFRGKKQIVLVLVPRGFGKTSILLYIVVLYLGIYLKYKYIFFVEETKEKARVSSMNFRNAIDPDRGSKKFLEVFGNVKGSPWSTDEVCVSSQKYGFEFYVAFRGIDTAMRGFMRDGARIQVAIVNDPEDQENKDFPDTEKIDKQLRKIQDVIIPGLQERDIYGRPGRIFWPGTTVGSDCMCLRAEGWSNVETVRYKALEVARDGTEYSTWEEMFTTASLKQKRKLFFEQGNPNGWYSEYQQEPLRQGKIKFKPPAYFTFDDLSGKVIKAKMAIDAAYSQKKSADPTGITVGGYTNDGVFRVLLSREGLYPPELFFKEMYDILMLFRKNNIEIRTISVEATAFSFVNYGWKKTPEFSNAFNGLMIPAKHPRDKKAERVIKHLLPLDYAGNFKLMEGWCEELEKQMKSFPHVSSWGCLDSAAQLVSVCIPPIVHTPDIEILDPSSPAAYLRRAEREREIAVNSGHPGSDSLLKMLMSFSSGGNVYERR